VPPILSDGVVLLDRHTDADVDAHVAGEDGKQARRFGWYPARSTAEGVRRAFEGWAHDWSSNGATRTFALRDASCGVLAGGVQVRPRESRVGQLSYWVFPPFRGRGFATRGLCLVSAWSFAELSLERLELHIEPDNEASRGVARAAGFVEEGLLPEHEKIGELFRDMILYSRERMPT